MCRCPPPCRRSGAPFCLRRGSCCRTAENTFPEPSRQPMSTGIDHFLIVRTRQSGCGPVSQKTAVRHHRRAPRIALHPSLAQLPYGYLRLCLRRFCERNSSLFSVLAWYQCTPLCLTTGSPARSTAFSKGIGDSPCQSDSLSSNSSCPDSNLESLTV